MTAYGPAVDSLVMLYAISDNCHVPAHGTAIASCTPTALLALLLPLPVLLPSLPSLPALPPLSSVSTLPPLSPLAIRVILATLATLAAVLRREDDICGARYVVCFSDDSREHILEEKELLEIQGADRREVTRCVEPRAESRGCVGPRHPPLYVAQATAPCLLHTGAAPRMVCSGLPINPCASGRPRLIHRTRRSRGASLLTR